MKNERTVMHDSRATAEAFGERVRELRKAKGYTQTELVERLSAYGVDMHQTTLAKLEGGTRPATVHELWAFAGALGCTFDQLMPRPPGTDRTELEDAIRAVELAERQVQLRERSYEEAKESLAAARHTLRQAESVRDRLAREHLVAIAEGRVQP